MTCPHKRVKEVKKKNGETKGWRCLKCRRFATQRDAL